MRLSCKQLFRLSRPLHIEPVAAAAALPIDIKDPRPRMPKRCSSGIAPRWMLKPPSAVSTPCLRVLVAGKLSQRVHRALRPLGCKQDALDAMAKMRCVDVKVRDMLLPADRVLLHLYVGGEQGLRQRQNDLAGDDKRSPTDSNELDVIDRVLAPFNALRALFDLEESAGDAFDETSEPLGRAVTEALCDDPAGVQKPAIALVACGLTLKPGGLFRARQRVQAAQLEALSGQAPSEPAKITAALGVMLEHLAHAGFPDVEG